MLGGTWREVRVVLRRMWWNCRKKYWVDCSPSSLHLTLERMAMASAWAFSSSLSLLVTAAMVDGLGQTAFWSLVSLLVKFLMLSSLLAFVDFPACLQYVFIASLISSHCSADLRGGCRRMICSIAATCFLDLSRDALKRHIGDL